MGIVSVCPAPSHTHTDTVRTFLLPSQSLLKKIPSPHKDGTKWDCHLCYYAIVSRAGKSSQLSGRFSYSFRKRQSIGIGQCPVSLSSARAQASSPFASVPSLSSRFHPSSSMGRLMQGVPLLSCPACTPAVVHTPRRWGGQKNKGVGGTPSLFRKI